MSSAPDTVAAPASLFDTACPRVFTMPPGAAFLDALARGMRDALSAGGAPFALADAVVFVPTRRAARALGEAFLRAAGPAPAATLLPNIRALGDESEDDPPFEPGDLAIDLPPAVSGVRRRFELAALLARKDEAQGRRPDPTAAMALAGELAELLDQLDEHDGDLEAINALYSGLPAHLQDAAHFLEIVSEHWPARLAELGRVDASARRGALVDALIARWQESPPQEPIIAAGSTGTSPATARLLAAIARLPRGLVVLPGLDGELDAPAWADIDDQHPQSALKRLVEGLGVARGAVHVWPWARESQAAADRRRVINEALRPAEATADWLARVEQVRAGRAAPDPILAGLDGLTVVEADDEDTEARVIALRLRAALEDPQARALLVTPSRARVRRVAALLTRWGVSLDSSMGAPLAETPLGGLLLQLAEALRDPDDPVAAAMLIKHPLAAHGLAADVCQEGGAALERYGLRGVRAVDGAAGWLARLHDEERLSRGPGLCPDAQAAGASVCAALQATLAPLLELGSDPRPVAEFARAHAEAVERATTTPDEPGGGRAWRGPAGEAGAALFGDLISESEAIGAITPGDYVRLFESLARAKTVRAPLNDSARVRALTPQEARLLSADVVVLAGLNEGVWPAGAGADPFLSRAMREAAGAPVRERQLGVSAHDFAQLASAPEVLLTRARREEGSPTVASRWVWRLQTFARGAGVEDALVPAENWQAWASGQDAPAGPPRPVPRPAPRPPVEARPTRASVSRIKEWIRDPYGFYARLVLRLYPLDELDEQTGPRQRGIALHEAAEATLKSLSDDTPQDAIAAAFAQHACSALLSEGFNAAELVRERPRAERAGAWFADWHVARRQAGWRAKALEEEGVLTVSAGGCEFTVTARADRIDVGHAGLAVIDYKTGVAPSFAAASAGLEPQIPLQGAIALAGGFTSLPAKPLASMAAVRVTGARNPGEEKLLVDARSADYRRDPAGQTARAATMLAKEAAEKLAERVALFARVSTPYVPHAFPDSTRTVGDFDRLSRRREWDTPDGEEDDA